MLPINIKLLILIQYQIIYSISVTDRHNLNVFWLYSIFKTGLFFMSKFRHIFSTFSKIFRHIHVEKYVEMSNECRK